MVLLLLINNPKTNPYLNLALEEHFLSDFEDDIVILWRNDKSIIIGRNQNALEEINRDFVEKSGIPIVRRLTGGGAVFHDLGNVNFTFIQKQEAGVFSDYRHFIGPVCEFLDTLGVQAQLSGRNDLMIDGMKFSGNAQTVKGGRIMHHGTLLFDANLNDISGALNPNRVKMESKGIQSVRNRVTNIASHLKEPMSVDAFLNRLSAFFSTEIEDIQEYELSDEDIRKAYSLVKKKYGTWEWNFGQSPEYNFTQSKRFEFGIVDLWLNVKAGIIAQVGIYGDFLGMMDKSELEKAVLGQRHRRQDIEEALNRLNINDYISGMDKTQFIDMLF